MTTKKSNHIISMMSLIGIVLVVFGHSGFEEEVVMSNLIGMHTWVYSFHMPLFFFISGYLYALTNKDFSKINTPLFLKKKFNRLYLPYIILGIIIFAIKYALSGVSHANREFSIQNFLMMFIAPHWKSSTMGYLWYIATLFFLFVFVSLLPKIKVNLRHMRTATIAITTMWILKFLSEMYLPLEVQKLFNIGSVLWYCPFFIIGVIYQPYEEKILAIIEKKNCITIILTNALLIIYTGYAVCYGGQIFFLKIGAALVGIVMTISIAQKFLNSNFVDKYLLPIGDITYTIYLMSFFGQYASKVLVVNLLHLHWSVCVLSMFVSGLVFPLAVYYTFNKMPMLHKSNIIKYCLGL